MAARKSKPAEPKKRTGSTPSASTPPKPQVPWTLRCPSCQSTSETTTAGEVPTLKCGDCLMARAEVVALVVEKKAPQSPAQQPAEFVVGQCWELPQGRHARVLQVNRVTCRVLLDSGAERSTYKAHLRTNGRPCTEHPAAPKAAQTLPAEQPVADIPHAEVLAWLRDHLACQRALRWVEHHRVPLSNLWALCERADWQLWMAEVARVQPSRLVPAACAVARVGFKHLSAEQQAAAEEVLRVTEGAARGEGEGEGKDVQVAVNALFARFPMECWSTHARSAAAAVEWAVQVLLWDDADTCLVALCVAHAEEEARDGQLRAVMEDKFSEAGLKVLAECAEAVRKVLPWQAVAAALQSRGEEVSRGN